MLPLPRIPSLLALPSLPLPDLARLRDLGGHLLPRAPAGLTSDPATWVVAGINALLSREPWARDKLIRHAGKTVRLGLGGLQASVTFTHEGLVSWAEPTSVPDVTLTVAAEKLSLERLDAVRRGKDGAAIADITHISGDAGLAQVVAELAQHLRWDVEDELAERIGDIPAMRVMQGVRAAWSGLRESSARLAGNAAEFISEERKLVTGRPVFADLMSDLVQLEFEIDQLAAEVGRAERLMAPSPAATPSAFSRRP